MSWTEKDVDEILEVGADSPPKERKCIGILVNEVARCHELLRGVVKRGCDPFVTQHDLEEPK
jgi:hypothetical protein